MVFPWFCLERLTTSLGCLGSYARCASVAPATCQLRRRWSNSARPKRHRSPAVSATGRTPVGSKASPWLPRDVRLVVTGTFFIFFPEKLGISLSQLTSIFQRGIPPTRCGQPLVKVQHKNYGKPWKTHSHDYGKLWNIIILKGKKHCKLT